MARRTQIWQQLPAVGGLNTSVDPSVLPQTDLQQCDNVTLLASGIKTKREGLSYFDSASDVPAVTHQASSGTTRTITFATNLVVSSAYKLVVGEWITLAGDANYSGTYAITNVSTNTITYTHASSLTESTTASTLTVTRTYPIIHIIDYWSSASGSQVQHIVGISGAPGDAYIFKYTDAGKRSQPTMTATDRTSASPRVNTCIMNNKLLIFSEGTSNNPVKYDGTEVTNLANAPAATMGTVWLARVWTNDKSNPDRLHYSATGTIETWSGASDSGAIDIRPGDGDPEGITSIFVFKGRLFVGKRNRLYQVVGDSPENFQVLEVSTGLGVEAHATCVSVDQNDVIYMSNKGIHSVATTANFGDFQAEYVSSKVQPSFNDLELSRLKYTQAVYVPTLNSIAFNVSEANGSYQDNIWLYNYVLKAWYKWPGINSTALGLVLMSRAPKLMIATTDGRLIQAQNGTYVDFTNTAINYNIKTGNIYPDGSPITVKGFKRLTLFFKPKTSYSFITRVRIDGFNEQVLGFSGSASGDLLDVDFILGTSLLGVDLPFAPRTVSIDGYGHGITIEVEQTGTSEQVDIYGYAIEYEVADFTEEGGGSNEGGN